MAQAGWFFLGQLVQKEPVPMGQKKGSRNYMENQGISGVSKKTYRVYDKDGKLKRIIEKAEEKTLTENEWLKGVTCFVINEKGEALIEVRANKGLTPGKKDLCSGHLDDRETETQAMIRELREELGIELEEARNVIKVTPQGVPLGFESKGKIKNFFITFYCLKRKTSKVEIQEEEIDKIVWLPLEEAFELIKSGRTKFPKNYDYSKIFEKVKEIYYGEKDIQRGEQI